MTARVLVIGLDSAGADLIDRWAAKGLLPTFSDLRERAAHCRLDNCMDTLPAAVWPEINTGLSSGKVGQYFHAWQIHTGEGRKRPVTPDEMDARASYWVKAADAGLRVVSFDAPQSICTSDLNGLEVVEWGLHDRHFATTSTPPSLIDDLRNRYGDHPVTGCDDHGNRPQGFAELIDGLLSGVQQKTEILLDLIGREDWDLFNCIYGETHCVGHQFWHFQDPNHPRYDPSAPEACKNAMLTVYQAIDAGIARLIDAAGPETTVLIYCSHGIRLNTGGYQLLPEILARLGLSSAPDRPVARRLRALREKVRFVPRRWKGFLYRIANLDAVRTVQMSMAADLHPLESPNTKAATLDNARVGAIRLNLKGREPHGCVAPGNEEKALIEDLRRDLLELKTKRNGEPIISRVRTSEEVFGRDHHPDLPDMLVEFRYDIGVIENCYSKRVGKVHVPRYSTSNPRSGDHSGHSRLWMFGPSIAEGQELPDSNTLDLAPTILKLLGVALPDNLDGSPIDVPLQAKSQATHQRSPAVASDV